MDISIGSHLATMLLYLPVQNEKFNTIKYGQKFIIMLVSMLLIRYFFLRVFIVSDSCITIVAQSILPT